MVGAAAVFVPSYLPYLATRSQQEGFEWRLEDITFLRAAPHIVEEANLVYGSWLGRPVFGLDGFHAFPGLVVIGLVVAGLVMAWGFARRDGSAAAPLLGAALTVTGALGALGPGWGRTTGWTPYALAFRFVPGFSAIRASGRFVLIVLLGFSVLTALAVAELARRGEGRPRADAAVRGQRRRGLLFPTLVAVLVVVGIAVEGAAGSRDVIPAAPHAVDRELSRLEEPGGVVYLPVAYEGLGDYDAQEGFVIRGAAHDRPMVNGFAGFYPRSARVLAERMADLPEGGALDCLAAHGIVFVVVSEKVGPLSPWADLRDPRQAEPLELLGTFDAELLYRVPDRDIQAGTCPLPGV